eukprot:Blabericola_migrator_1__13402@NODE_958_length_5894_cov_24_472113_g664_i0_p1_GENE_NODE_958_length_5894_cov_24_472113_g664_i0NODE_958_length_5894_cov_24_472113_g664_i0_p1_ORF_typecomplete_len618_score105_83ATG16/PF08614_11/0_16ATG16/PF08614_11/0_46ATG16/PF08614_11/17ATG16/PF08614_11/3_9e02ADIP/PF11559_8/1_2ADIP/PF11559_8/3_9ADIP/PF11559_8/0_074ADIP/PF11559_8/0_19ADIP/PF11559_8/1_3e03HOOK/PF05622_12/0_00016HOOK/PF05622_12/3_5DUF3450/PF11932_8/89DUF3450/PF11932_8/6_6e02DUF3450/PF11932_8/9_8e05DUF345
MALSSVSSSFVSNSDDSSSEGYSPSRNVGATRQTEHAMDESGDESQLREKLRAAHQKIKDLTDEVQRLLVEKVTLQTEVSQLKFELAGRSDSPAGADGGNFSSFEAVRHATMTRTEMAEKDRELAALRTRCADLEDKMQSLKYRISVHNDQMVAGVDVKKKKTWWGGTKKSKSSLHPSPTLLVTDDADVIQAPVTPVPASSSSSKTAALNELMAHSQQIARLQKRHTEKVEELNQRIITLEREKAKADAEVELLEKERRTLQERVRKLESVIESLKAQQNIYADPERASGIGRNMQIPLAIGSSEADRWKSMVQIQESALRKIATQKEELERQLAYLSDMHGDTNNRYAMTPEVTQLREDILVQNRLLTQSKAEIADLNIKVKAAELREKYLVDEIQKAKNALAEYDKLLTNKAEIQRKHQNAVVSMLGAALADNEILQEKTSEHRQQYTKDITSLHGEVRALRQGRAGRMKGEAPSNPVFPSPNVERPPPAEDSVSTGSASVIEDDYHFHLHTCRKASVITAPKEPEASSESSESQQGAYDAALAGQYHYEWSNGAYVLRHTPTPPVAPAVPSDLAPTMVEMPAEPDDEKNQKVARDALRTWNATPPRQRPISLTR